MTGLTQRQREILDFIESYSTTHRIAPSYRDIKQHFGFSSLGTVYNQIRVLKKKGVLENHGCGARSLSIVSKESSDCEVPLIGKIEGGMPIQTFAHITMLPLPAYLVPTEGECYLLRVEGAALVEESILENDLLLVDPRPRFEAAETIIALVDKTTTFVKKGFFDSPYYRLESNNPQVQPLILHSDHVIIQGVVIGLVRNYSF